MKQLELDFLTRFKLSGILAEADGPLGKITPLLAVYEKVRFNEDEAKQITVEQSGNMVTYKGPADNPEFGTLDVDVEDAHATAVLNELEAWQHFKIADVTWVEKLKGCLKV